MSLPVANKASPHIAVELEEPLSCPFTLDIFAPNQATAGSILSSNVNSTGTHIINAPLNGYKNVTTGTTPLSLPLAVEETLPTFRHDKSKENKGKILEIADDIAGFIESDLDLSRLNRIHHRMWACGRPLNARSLHTQIMNNRKITKTEQADLHLLYYNDTLLLKPLPSYLLSPTAWELYLNIDRKKHQNAAGLLLSYIWLIRSPLDYSLATSLDLLPPTLSWPSWKLLTSQFLHSIDANALDQVNPRYHFGELRLGRINTIYRTSPSLFLLNFVRGYLYGYNRYVVFFQRNVGWVLVVFVWFSLILSAMQVGTTVKGLDGNEAFNRASYGFVIFSIVMVAALLGFVGSIFLVVFLYNMVAAIGHQKSTKKERDRLTQARLEGKKDV